MNYLIVGLGNPGDEYKNSRHNAGRMAVDFVRTSRDFPEWEMEKKAKGFVSKGELGGKKTVLLLPETFMNNSGESIRHFAKSAKDAEKVIVVYDDMDIPFGAFKISYDRSSGGHNGVQSVIDHLKTEKFVRVRIGLSSVTAKGVVKRPSGEKPVHDFVLGDFKKAEDAVLKKLFVEVADALECVVKEGREMAMGKYN